MRPMSISNRNKTNEDLAKGEDQGRKGEDDSKVITASSLLRWHILI